MREARGAAQLVERGFSAPRTLAVIERVRFGFIWESLLISASVADETIVEWFSKKRSRGERKSLLQALGAEVGRIHRSGLIHGDMNPSNILVSANGDSYRFTWVDNERVGRPFGDPWRGRVRNLKELNKLGPGSVRYPERFCVWRSYMEALSGTPETSDKAVLQKVVAQSKQSWTTHGTVG